MARGFGTPGGVVTDEDQRLAQAGLFTPQSSSLAVRTGVLWGPGATALVTGTSATGTMTVAIAAHHWVTTRGTADGVYYGALEAATTVNIAAAPGANSRIDVVWVKQNDSASTISPDGSNTFAPGVTTGTAAVSPVKPSIPVGAQEIATVTVAVGATATNGAGVTIANTAPLTVARGACVPVRTQAERDALTQYDGLIVNRLDLDQLERSNGSTWKRIGGDVTLGGGFYSGTAALVVAATPGWTDVATFTGTSLGGECVVQWAITLANGNSGADRTGSLRVICDATVLGSIGPLSLLLANLPRIGRAGEYSSTPGAGSHTWKLQANGSAASSVVAEMGSIHIVEK